MLILPSPRLALPCRLCSSFLLPSRSASTYHPRPPQNGSGKRFPKTSPNAKDSPPSRSKRSFPPTNFKDSSRPQRNRDFSRPRPPPQAPKRPKQKPSPTQLLAVLAARLPIWAISARAVSRLVILGFERGQARACLDGFATVAAEELRKQDGARWDVEGLRTALEEDEDWLAALEKSMNRALLSWVVSPSSSSPSPLSPPTLPAPFLAKLSEILTITDLSDLTTSFPSTRPLRRSFHLHIGPTNSGKTYSALTSLASAPTGAYAGPLRLLAHEVWERMNRGTVGSLEVGKGRECNLLTGEERRIVSPEAGLISCTVEMMPTSRLLDVAVVDEIQMIGDPQRGGSWTNAVLGIQAPEIHLCGEETVVGVVSKIIASLGDTLTIHRYTRLTPLVVASSSLEDDLSQIKAGDCIVAFSRTGIFALKRKIEMLTGKRCAVVYGALPPETRSEQARLFNEEGNGVDVMVASDAVGMGLNLKIKRMIFETLHKFNGKAEVRLSTSQVKQIAGRAGRFGLHSGTSNGEVTTLKPDDLPLLREILPSEATPIPRAVLEPPFSSITQLAMLLPPETTYPALLETFADLARVPEYCVFSDTKTPAALADLLAPWAGKLTLSEMNLFTYAPVNTRDVPVVAAYNAFVGEFVESGRVEVEEVLRKQTRLLETLTLVEETKKSFPDITPEEAYQTGQTLAPIPPVIVSTLPVLESLHRSLILYIWLSFRLEVAFVDRLAAVALKERTEAVLEFCLERLPGMKRPGGAGKGRMVRKRVPLEEVKQVDPIAWMTRDELEEQGRSLVGSLNIMPERN